MRIKPSLVLAAAASLAALLSSCNVQSGGGGLAAYHAYDLPTKLPTNPNNVRVKVSLSKQRAYVMEGSTMLLAMPVSVGTPATPTPAGSFTIFGKEPKHRASTHGYAYSGSEVKQTFLDKKPHRLVVQRHADALLVRVQAQLRVPYRLDQTPALHPRLHPHA